MLLVSLAAHIHHARGRGTRCPVGECSAGDVPLEGGNIRLCGGKGRFLKPGGRRWGS
jgi:hypothetical protein